ELLSRARAGSALPEATRVFASRTGRIWAGAVGIAGAAAMAIAAAATATNPPLVHVSSQTFLFLSWPAMGVSYALGRVLAERRMGQETAPAETGNIHADLARLEQARSVAEVRGIATRREMWSVALPMMAVALLGPLTIHCVFCLLTGIV